MFILLFGVKTELLTVCITVDPFRQSFNQTFDPQTVNFEDYPIRTAHFSADGREFIVASRQHSHFYVYDMEKGKSVSE